MLIYDFCCLCSHEFGLSIVILSFMWHKWQLRVDLTGDQTERVFGKTLRDLGRTAPPVPGFRMQKGGKEDSVYRLRLTPNFNHIIFHCACDARTALGKSSQIPNDFLLQMLGEERVIKFVIQEILNSTMADYVEKASDILPLYNENLDVKDRKISTIQTAEELKQSFKPGKEFGFNVIIEPKSSEDTG
ncbi:hypothetical protein Ahy_A07g035872 isoform C [Arachis hypogaea]|uniref:Trigger factor ribosome-binding bacterial domain-containing protein n=1 Tax=Arachis hypogaea TaxID=3818 RepID=A0A445CEN3_ARAHY|nr:hypothetical protein Ahy_A07g035872 isoform C [Arachis hypogaea]